MLKLFRSTPKWQHPKPQKRIEALATLNPTADRDLWILMKLAREDGDAGVRREAVGHLQDMDAITQIHKRDTDAEVREAALQRLHDLLAGKAGALPLEQRLGYLPRIGTPPTLLHLANEADALEIRLAAIACLKDESHLAEIALHSPVARLRQAAAERINTPAQLEAVAEATRQKDKSVHRIVRGRLDELARREKSAQEQQRRREALCASMEAHAHAAFNPLYAAKAESLRQQWQELTGGESPTLSERFETAFALAWQQVSAIAAQEQRQADQAQAREEMQQCVATLEATLNEYHGQDDFDLPALSALRKTQRLRWELATQLQAAPAELAARHASASARLEKLEALLVQWQQDRLMVEATLARLPLAEAPEKQESLHLLQETLKNYSAFDLPLPALLTQIPTTGTPTSSPEKAGADDKAGLRKKLETLLAATAASVEAGNSRDATRHLHKAREFVRQHHLHDARLAELGKRVHELKSWAGFAVQPKKEALIVQMETLAAREMDPDDKADAIHALQEEWKTLGVAAPAVEQPLWERFKAAGDQAFEPCRAHFAAQRELRQHNLEKRIALCEQLESYRNALPTEVDWKNHEAILRTARREWQQYQPSDRHKTRPVQERFHAILHALEKLQHEYWQKNEDAKRQLIAQAQALLQQQDLNAACEQAKQLQRQWKETAPASHKAEHRLWQEFRGACDALFSKRDAAFKARQEERDQLVQQAEALVRACEELAASPDLLALRSEATRLDDAFHALSLPRDKADTLRRRFNEARKRYQQASQQQAEQQKAESREQRLREWQALCERDAANAQDEKALALLLDLEIQLDLPSPDALQEARRARQMERLQAHGLRKTGSEEAGTILATLLQTPVNPALATQALERLRSIQQKIG